MSLKITDHERRVLEIIASSEANRGVATTGWVTHQLWYVYPDQCTSEHGKAYTGPEIQGTITRLVHKGYVRREGTNKLRWYRPSSMGRGYLEPSDPVAYAREHLPADSGAHALLDEVERGRRRRSGE